MFSTPLLVSAAVAGVILVIAMLVLIAYGRLYKRATADEAVVRTGKGGTVAVAGGGIFVIPMFHNMGKISLKQVMISITRSGNNALVTLDKIRADVDGTMYVRVGDSTEDIIQAAKTFGEVNASEIERLISDKVTDAMRAEAMKVSFLELNMNKREFAEAIAAAVQQDLKKTGLILDSVAITTIRQVEVDPEAIPMDVFEAEGVRNIVAVVEKNREETNRIRRAKEIEIKQVDVDARKRGLLLEEQQRQAEAEQTQRVAIYEAERSTEARKGVLAQERQAEEAAIAKAEEIARREIAKDKALAVDTAAKEEAEKVALTRAQQAVEQAAIDKAKTIEAATIDKEMAVQTAEIDKLKAIATAKAEEALARAARAEAEATEEEKLQAVKTVTERSEADRERQVAIIKAQEEADKHKIDADRDAYVETRRAEAEREARRARAEAEAVEALERARAQREAAQGRGDALRIDADAHAADIGIRARADADAAELQAKAKIELAHARLEEGKATAEAERLLVEARNQLATHLVLRDVALAAIDKAPAAIEAFMKPAEAIGEMKVLQVGGLSGESANGNSGSWSAGLPGMLAGTLAQSAGLMPVIRTMLEFAKDAGLASKAKELVSGASEAIREATSEPAKLDSGPAADDAVIDDADEAA